MHEMNFTMNRGSFRGTERKKLVSPTEQIPEHAPDIEQMVFKYLLSINLRCQVN